MRLVWLLLLLAGATFWLVRDFQNRPVARPPGVLAPQAPAQTRLERPKVLSKNGHQLFPQARFELRARVLAKRTYRDRGAEISPLDLALGWGRMSDTAVLRRFAISQSNRFYFWTARELPIPYEEVVTSSANMHFVPANDTLRPRLMRLKPGNVVWVRGYLVNATGPDSFYWNTSLTRADTGNGACEIVYVEDLRVQ